ncbi:hypothetical protein [Methylobacterium sp. SD21]|uniref:hypothetical protein n=1 Tax=Methylobacterium litchii TaxID=3138810 RepID=UPI00313D9990
MHDEAPPADKIEPSEALASSNLLALATTITTMQRLLGRRAADGSLVPAEATMIQLAVEGARAEVRAVAAMLIALPVNPTSTQRNGVATLLKAIANIDVVLDVLADAVDKADR